MTLNEVTNDLPQQRDHLVAGVAAVSVAANVQAAQRVDTGMNRTPYAADLRSYGPPHGFFDDWYRRSRSVGPNAVRCGGVGWEYHGGTAGM